MQAILTKYYGPTNTKGSRIKASCAGGSLWMPYGLQQDAQAEHEAAANLLVEKMGWVHLFDRHRLVSGGLPGNMGYCHVFCDD